jgi:hypothetical protein
MLLAAELLEEKAFPNLMIRKSLMIKKSLKTRGVQRFSRQQTKIGIYSFSKSISTKLPRINAEEAHQNRLLVQVTLHQSQNFVFLQ